MLAVRYDAYIYVFRRQRVNTLQYDARYTQRQINGLTEFIHYLKLQYPALFLDTSYRGAAAVPA